MSTDCFQTQFASVMESVLKTAVAETTKLFETTIEELGAEISRIKEENDDLKTKLLSLENEKKSINSSESQSEEPGPSPTGSRIEQRDIGIQCALPAVRAAMADGCFGSYQYGSPSTWGAEHEEDMVTELQSVTFEDGNPQMAFILIKQEEPDCEDCAPGYILLKQEGGEPALVRRQPLRDIPALLPGAVRALVNRGTQGRPHATQPALAAAMAAFQKDPGPQVPPHTLSPARTRGATKASAVPDEAPGAGEQSSAPAAQSAAPAQSLPAQVPDTQPPMPPLPQPAASSPIQPSAAAPQLPATLPTESSPVRQRAASASLAVSPTLSERSEVTMAMLMLAHSAPRPPSAHVTTETTVTPQRSQPTEPMEPSVAPSPAADAEKSILAPLQLSSFKELPSGPLSQMTKHQFLAQLEVKPLSPAQIALAACVAGTGCGEISSQGQLPTNGDSEQTERLSSVPTTFTETVETRSVATETVSVDKKEGGSGGDDKESFFSCLRFRLRPRLQSRATEPEPAPVSPKKPRVAKVLTVNCQSKVRQNGGRPNRSVNTPVVSKAPEGASVAAAPPKRSTGGTTRGRGTPHAPPVSSPTPQRRLASTRKATPRMSTQRRGTPRMATPRRTSLRTATLRTMTPRTTTLRTTTPRTASPRSPSPRMTRPHSASPSTASPRKATLRTTSPPEDPVRAMRTDPQQHQGPGSPRLPPHRGETPRTTPTPHTATPRSATAFKMSPQSPFQTSTPPFTSRRRLLKNQCAQCGRILSSATALESHVSLHTGERPFACTACARTFPDHKGLNRHARVHRTERGHECTQCGKSFVYRFGLTKHLQVVHSGIRPFSCMICSKRFVTKRDLETHYRMHTGEKPFQCSLCVKSFKRPVELNIHMRWHNGEKRHWCPHCGKGFLDYNNLKRHKLIHTGEKPHSCPQCTKHFTQSGHLKKHLKNVHKVR